MRFPHAEICQIVFLKKRKEIGMLPQ